MKNRMGTRAAAILAGLLIAVAAFSLPSSAADGSMTVYITKTGSCYHLEGCRTLRSRIPTTLRDAVNRGYAPCGVCNPPLLSADASAPARSTATASSAPTRVSAPAPAPAAAAAQAPAAAAEVPAAQSISAPAAAAPTLAPEQAVDLAFARYVQAGLAADAAFARVQAILPRLQQTPENYAAIVDADLLGVGGAPKTAAQLADEAFAAYIAQGLSSDEALLLVQTNLAAITAGASQ